MPIYVVQDTTTEEETELYCSWNELQSFLTENPDHKLMPAAPAIVSGVAGRYKTDEGFKDVLRTIKKRNPGSTVDVV